MKILVFYTLALLAFTACTHQKKLVVAKDGSAPYTTVQQAFDAVKPNSKKRVFIYVMPGTYEEKLYLDSTKRNVYLIGKDKFNTILTYNDHTGKKAKDGSVIDTRTSYSFQVNGANFTAKNITFQNNAGFSAGQAVAVEVQGDKAAFFNCRFLGNQDVLFTNNPNSRQYYKDCYIEGTTDFIFGSSTAWFQRCHIHSKKNSHVTAASTPKENAYGYVFNECILTADTAFKAVSLGRPWRPYSAVAYLHCFIDRHIIKEGWDNWKNKDNERTARYVEFENYGPGADVTERVKWSRQLTTEVAKAYNIKQVLKGWNPEGQ